MKRNEKTIRGIVNEFTCETSEKTRRSADSMMDLIRVRSSIGKSKHRDMPFSSRAISTLQRVSRARQSFAATKTCDFYN